MKRIAQGALVLGFLANLPAAFGQTIAPPTFKEGDAWEIQTLDMWSSRMTARTSKQVIGVSGDFVRLSYDTREVTKTGDITRPQESESTMRADLNVTVMFGSEKMEKLWYKWPLEVGKKWSSSYKQEYPASTSGGVPQIMTTVIDAEAKGWENVDVPAGKFKAFKIVYKATWTTTNPTSNGSYLMTKWYAPEVKGEVQVTSDGFAADGSPQSKSKQQLVSYSMK